MGGKQPDSHYALGDRGSHAFFCDPLKIASRFNGAQKLRSVRLHHPFAGLDLGHTSKPTAFCALVAHVEAVRGGRLGPEYTPNWAKRNRPYTQMNFPTRRSNLHSENPMSGDRNRQRGDTRTLPAVVLQEKTKRTATRYSLEMLEEMG
jgi:hypothetical protein